MKTVLMALAIFLISAQPLWTQSAEDLDDDGVPDDLERQLAEKFAPVLHKHSQDRQEGLADFNQILSGHSTLKAYESTTGKTLYNKRTPPIHTNVLWHYDSFGRGSIPTFWLLDIDDDVRHSGATVGNRPLYYHVYKDGGNYYLQYWYFFTMNDLTGQIKSNTWHEGDWEHVSIKIMQDGYSYVPVAVNFHQHYGGYTADPAKVWWSTGYGVNYGHLEQGYKDRFILPCPPGTICKPVVRSLSHLHIWIARNSHASFNRYHPLYAIDVLISGDHFQDEVEYDTTDLIFEYDKLVNMGEVYHSPQADGWDTAHGYKWFEHYVQKPAKDAPALEGLAFIGHVGEFWAHVGAGGVTPPSALSTYCLLMCSSDKRVEDPPLVSLPTRQLVL